MDLAPRATLRRARGTGSDLRTEVAGDLRSAAKVRAWSTAGAVVVVAAGVVLRFLATSELWLDEALAVNIARLPLSELPEALRHDGAPPLYYALLHGWMSVFGDGPTVVRSMSGLFAVAALPLAWAAGNRVGGRRVAAAAVVLLASSPFAIRYATEARMYALVVLLVLAGHLLLARALEQPSHGRLAALAVVTGLLLLTHYWSLFLVGAVGLTLIRPARRGEASARRCLMAVAAGFVALLPWLPVMAYQARRTGTPWAVRPGLQDVVDTFRDFGGGPVRTASALSVLLIVLLVLGVLGRPVDGRRIELDLGGRAGARPLLFLTLTTLTAAFAVAQVTQSAFVPRYASVVLAPLLLLVALGTTVLAHDALRRAVLGLAVVLGLVGAVSNVGASRTQAGEVARALDRLVQPGDVVAYCPDQLGPAVSRLLPPTMAQVTFPDFASPARVDWVDYAERNRAADPRAYARRLIAMAGPRNDVFVVFAGRYRSLGFRCEAVVAGLGTRRAEIVRVPADPRSFERMTLLQFPAW